MTRPISIEILSALRLQEIGVAAAYGVLLTAVSAAPFLTWRYITPPPRPWLVRWRLDRYLANEAHTGNFKTDFPFPAKSEMGKALLPF